MLLEVAAVALLGVAGSIAGMLNDASEMLVV